MVTTTPVTSPAVMIADRFMDTARPHLAQIVQACELLERAVANGTKATELLDAKYAPAHRERDAARSWIGTAAQQAEYALLRWANEERDAADQLAGVVTEADRRRIRELGAVPLGVLAADGRRALDAGNAHDAVLHVRAAVINGHELTPSLRQLNTDAVAVLGEVNEELAEARKATAHREYTAARIRIADVLKFVNVLATAYPGQGDDFDPFMATRQGYTAGDLAMMPPSWSAAMAEVRAML